MKSNESICSSDPLELVQAVYEDACAKCSADVFDVRDLETIRSRVKSGGISFLTISLPSFCRDFERSLDRGEIDSSYFQYFRKYGAIPAFLRGMLSHIFDQKTGRKFDDSSDTPVLIEAVRQVCLLFKKVELPCSPARENAAIENYIKVESLNRDFTVPQHLIGSYRVVAEVLWSPLLGALRTSELVPKHGPGTTSERILGNQKYVWKRWHERLEPYFPFLGDCLSMSAVGEREFEMVRFVPEDEEDPVRVILVPKTLKSPRIIAAEPVCMQYAQQAVQSLLVDWIEGNWLTRGHVNFRDQQVNQRLALEASSTGQYATIDLSDASDRVPAVLVSEMLDSVQELKDIVFACRSNYAKLPDGSIIGPLAKFASMGSALCFPIEAMNFYTICVVAALDKHNLPATPQNIFKVSRGIYVYGDDIVVPLDQADIVLDYLQQFNCKVNDDKTFKTGRFRESCGVDAYGGYEVTPVYLRSMCPQNKQQAQEIASWVATANQFYLKGYWRTASLMFAQCERVLGKSLPYVSPESPALGRISFLGYRSVERWNDSTHSFEVRGWVLKTVYRCDRVDGYSALQKSLLGLERREPSRSRTFGLASPWADVFNKDVLDVRGLYPDPSDAKHLERSARRGAVTLNLRWVPAT